MSDNESGSIDATPFTPILLSDDEFARYKQIHVDAGERQRALEAQFKEESNRWWNQFAADHNVDLLDGIFAIGQSPDAGYLVVRLTEEEAEHVCANLKQPAVPTGAPAGEVVH